jgi:hypothetical protein
MYYMRLGHCKFGNTCSYLHCASTPVESVNTDIVKLKKDLQEVLTALTEKDIQIKLLEEKVNNLEMKTYRSNNIQNDSIFKCALCEYEAPSSKNLKSHNTTKHKPEVLFDSNSTEIPSNGWEPKTCRWCNQTFSQHHNFKDHMVEHHGLLFNSDGESW